MRLLLWILESRARSVLCHHCLYFHTFFQDINTKDITATDAQSPCCEVSCAANETLCDLLSLEGLPDATRKSPRELVMNIKACEKHFAKNSSSTRNFGFSSHCLPDGQYLCEQLQVKSSGWR